MVDTIMSVVKENRRRRSFFEGTEGPWENNFKALQHEVATNRHDAANCAQGLLQLQEELSQMRKRAAKSEEQVEIQSQELQQLREELNDLRHKVRGVRHEVDAEKEALQKAEVERETEEAEVVEVTEPPILLEGEAKEEDEEQEEISAELTVDHLLRSAQGYFIKESMWDACAFIGFKCVGCASSLLIVFGGLCAAALEALFATLVYVNYREHSYTDDNLDGLLHWRAIEAQGIHTADVTKYVSLASSVCSEAASVGIAGSQSTVYSDLKLFRGKDVSPGFELLNGHFLCNMALILWILSVLRDLGHNWSFMIAVTRHSGGTASIQEARDEIRIVSFSFTQKCTMVFLVFLPRLIIDLMLGYAGIWFLCYTANVSELLLNSVALVFVLDIDELLYHALLNEKVKILMSAVQPLAHGRKLEQSCSKFLAKGYHIFVLRILTTGIALAMCNWLVIFPFNERLDRALAYLCAGNKDFVYLKGDVNQVVSYAKAEPYNAESMYALTYTKAAVLQLIDLPEKYADRYPYLRGIPQGSIKRAAPTLNIFRNLDARFQASTVHCVDHTNYSAVHDTYAEQQLADGYYQSSLALLEEFSYEHNIVIKDCSEFKFELCLHPSMLHTRSMCAKFCACDSPWQGQFFATGSFGCPVSCEIQWELNAQYFAPARIAQYTGNCMDVPKEVLSTEPSWLNYVTGIKAFLTLYMSDGVSLKAANALMESGCDRLPFLLKFVEVCNPLGTFRSARPWCPKTCLCSSFDMRECPSSCSHHPRYRQMPAGQACSDAAEIESAADCKAAYYSLMQVKEDRNITNLGNMLAPPSGCFLSSSGLMFSDTGGGTLDSSSIAICKTYPLLFDKFAEGSFESGQALARKWFNTNLTRAQEE